MKTRMPFAQRIAQIGAAQSADACWEWPGTRTKSGYGYVNVLLDARGQRMWSVHRAAYTLLVGPIPEGMEIDHLCRNRACMNPRHLEAVTSRENTLRSENIGAKNARKTHCKHGHAFTPANTVYRRSGHRDCLMCKQERGRRAMKKQRQSTDGRERIRRAYNKWYSTTRVNKSA